MVATSESTSPSMGILNGKEILPEDMEKPVGGIKKPPEN